MQLQENIKIQTNKIIIHSPSPKTHYFILLSHPQRHTYISHDPYNHSFISNQTSINHQHVGVVKVTHSKIFQNIQALISTDTTNHHHSQPLSLIYITKYIALLDCCRPQLQQLTPQDVLLMLQHLKQYGEIKGLVPQGNTLVVKYQNPITLKTHFIIPTTNDTYSTKLPYYAISGTLPFPDKHRKLLSLPISSAIQEIKLHQNWLIVRNKDSILFLKIAQPFDIYHVFNLQNSQGIFSITANKIAIAQYKYLNMYKIKQNKVFEHSKVKLKGLQPYCYCIHNNSYFFAGINHIKKILSTIFTSLYRYIHIYDNFSQIDFKKHSVITADRTIKVCQANEPITMLHFVEQLQSIACYCERVIYIVSIDEQLLAKASVQHQFTSILHMPYHFNITNYIGIMEESFLKVGVDAYNNKVGMEIQQYKSLGKVKFITLNPDLYISDGQSISKWELISETKSHYLVKSKDDIVFMAGKGNIIIYTVSNNNSFDFHCIVLA